jgi:hypothetical protein
MDISTMRGLVRRDLHDEDAANYRWTDDELDRHIARAVKELSLAAPLEAKAGLTTSAGSRDLSISSLSDVVGIEAVEYPVDEFPPCYVRYSLWENTLTLLVDGVPSGGEDVNVYYTKLHTLDATSSTLPSAFEDLVATGAAGYAALEWASFATNRLNAGGEDAWRAYMNWGQERLSVFTQSLASVGRKNSVRARQLYRPYEPKASQSTDWGP